MSLQVASTLPTTLSQKLRALRSLLSQKRADAQHEHSRDHISSRLIDVFVRTWDLGFTAFGGPPVHFQILHQRFVEGRGGKEKWVDEQTYQELFAICQGLPGPGSTKMLFCLTLLHAGFVPAVFAFLIWSLPGAIGMYGLSLGVQRMNEILPSPVYALLSGLNSSTVGIIALAAVQLAEKAIKDKLTRILVIMGAVAGLCYNALWYFPTLMAIGGITAVVWDGWLNQKIRKLSVRLKRRRRLDVQASGEVGRVDSIALQESADAASTTVLQRRVNASQSREMRSTSNGSPLATDRVDMAQDSINTDHVIRIKVGIALVLGFLASFIAVMVVRGVVDPLPLAYNLFANMYLAGTVIFGGGPVVIPLLRSYVVEPGWVSGRDFLLGLAIIQAFPGPNFNFAVYLGALALQRSQFPTVFGAFLGFLGIFTPGLTLAVAVQSFWRVLRRKKWVLDLLRGVNATAVGLVFTAVYRLWEIGYLTPEASNGQSLALEPWWVVVATLTYAESAWFGVPPALAIVIGGVLGLGWYGAVGQ